MRLTFPAPMTQEEYPHRNEWLRVCDDECKLVEWYLRVQPHTLLHAGHLASFLNRHRLGSDGLRILSVGVDFVKEFYLSRLAGVSLHVVDLDAGVVTALNAIAQKRGLPLSYETGDILRTSSLESGDYSILLLSQIDYILSDEQLGELFGRAASNPRLRCVVVLSPSLFHWPGRDWLAGAREAIRFAENLRMLVSARAADHGAAGWYSTYRRSVGLLRRLAGKGWVLGPVERYDYPSGTMHTHLFRKR